MSIQKRRRRKKRGSRNKRMRTADERQQHPRGRCQSIPSEARVIRFGPQEAVPGFEVLLHSGQVQALPHDTYVVGPEQVALLAQAGIRYVTEKE